MLRSLNQQVLRAVFRIQEGEGLRVAVMLLYSIAAIGGVIITGQLASRALFLSALPQTAIPYKFILPPLVLMVVSWGVTVVVWWFHAFKERVNNDALKTQIHKLVMANNLDRAIKVCGAFLTVEYMRRGLKPADAALETLRRVVATSEPRLLDDSGHPTFGLSFYAVNKEGEFGAATMTPGRYAAFDGETASHYDTAYLFEGFE